MPPAARIADTTGHGNPLGPGPGANSPPVMIGYMPAWRALPAGLASAVEGLSSAMEQLMKKPAMTPADAAADLAKITMKMSEVGTKGAAAGSPGTASAAGIGASALASTNVGLTSTWTAASAAPGGQPAANAAYAKGIQAAAATAAAAVMASLAGVSDMHICPIPTPVPPHGPGFVTRGSNSVLINNLPACRQGDKVIETCGGADPITIGCTTVLIGDQGGSGGGGGGAGAGGGGSGGAGAGGSSPPTPASAGSVPPDQAGPVLPPEEEEGLTWIGIVLKDFNGEPLADQSFNVTLTGGQVLSGVTDSQGYCRLDGVRQGSGEVVFTSIPDAQAALERQQEDDQRADPDRQDVLPGGRVNVKPEPASGEDLNLEGLPPFPDDGEEAEEEDPG